MIETWILPLYMYITDILLAFPSIITRIGIQFWAAININSGLSVLLFPKRNLFRIQKNAKSKLRVIQTYFSFEINLGKSRIRHTTTLKLNDEFEDRLKTN